MALRIISRAGQLNTQRKARQADLERKRLAKLAFSLNQLETKRIGYEKKYLELLSKNAPDNPYDVYIERLFQRQKKLVVELLTAHFKTGQHQIYLYIQKWLNRNQTERILPIGEGWQFNYVNYYKPPKQFKNHPAVLALSASYPSLQTTSIIGPRTMTDQIALTAKENISLLLKYVENSKQGKKKFPWLWSIDENLTNYFTSTQIHNFVLPELKRLRSRTKNQFIREQANYFYVFLKRVDGIDLVTITQQTNPTASEN